MRKNRKNNIGDDGFNKNKAFENEEIKGIDAAVYQYGNDEIPRSEHPDSDKVNVDPLEPIEQYLASPERPAESDDNPAVPIQQDIPVGTPEPKVMQPYQKNEKSGLIVDIYEFIYDIFYAVGIQSYRYSKRISVRLGRLAMKPLRYIYSLFRLLVLGVDRLLFRSLHAVHEEAVFLRKEIRSSNKYLHMALKEDPLSIFSILWHYIKKAFAKHKEMFRTAANLSMPAAALIVLWLTVTYWNSVTFSIKLSFEETNIGYVQDEAVYVKARSLANEQLGDTANIEKATETATGTDAAQTDETGIEKPDYELALVKLNQLSDESALLDNLIDESGKNFANACGIFVDGKFIGAVKNETDATGVFDSILEPYKTNDADTIAAFVEDVKFTQGLYPNDTKMIDAKALKDILTGKKSEAYYHTVQGGETFWDIARANGMSVDTLLAMNPGGPDQVIKSGDKIKISNEVNYLRVKLIKTEVRSADIGFEIIKTDNSNLFKGDTRITRKGVLGQESIKELVTYIDGIRVDAVEIERTRLSEPVAQKVDVGIKSTTVYGTGGSYNVSVSKVGFVWPVPGYYSVSSPFGYRSRGYHSGVDISGSGINGKIIVAAKDGVVEKVTISGSGLGNSIVINHGGGVKTRYGHCLSGSISVSTGQRVSAGQAIARVGSTGNSTGPHLHFEVVVNGSAVNPLPYIR